MIVMILVPVIITLTIMQAVVQGKGPRRYAACTALCRYIHGQDILLDTLGETGFFILCSDDGRIIYNPDQVAGGSDQVAAGARA